MKIGHSFAIGLALGSRCCSAPYSCSSAAMGREDLGAAAVVAFLMVGGALWWLWHYVQATNVALARFIDAVRFGDFAQGFAIKAMAAASLSSAPRSTSRSRNCAASATR
jgi:hypothetical protein